ncbi:cupredoxin domain-containing protein [Fodinibius saliphilus]|uniref:cupredoxin domain-containing protein n=1 Tax=Fodinibius saliphilus TaxID=1920650 RepID=UPI001108F0BD|nr:plastocyanin/azurin family copper-binding protein [Fodinibius saliphilus]
MFNNNRRNIILSIIVSLLLFFAGCGDSMTSSGEEGGQSASFDSGTIGPGETFTYTFSEEEVVEYYCTIHIPDMQGQITVTSNAKTVDRDTVSMENNKFVPENLEVAPNTEVIWINNQDHTHDIKTGNPSNNGGGDDY